MSIGKSLDVLTIGCAIPAQAVDSLRSKIRTVHFYPDGDAPADVLAETQIYYSGAKGPAIEDFKKALPNLVHLQLQSAGAEKVIKNAALQKALKAGEGDFTVSTASGLHCISIPQYILGTLLAIYLRLPKQILVARTEARWASGEEIAEGVEAHGENDTPYFVRSLRGKTVGFLGYGHIARAAARLLQPHGVEIIAANTTGTRREDDGYVIPGTGDPEGSLPTAFYSTTDGASLDAFLSKCDVVVASLPSTPATRGLLTKERLGLLPADAVLINVGRGDLVTTENVLWALDRPGGLWGFATDVTDPEPLPEGHPLYKHYKAIVTPHLSGDAEGELALGADILAFNIERIKGGKKAVNVVDFKKGY
ncbi:hypothetical protein MNV49_000430 [Pseudohyphozyma bogoriensis]|nr:hypothetical protein MNV49_000430 [Pseudohyphozyma bogoriensis]